MSKETEGSALDVLLDWRLAGKEGRSPSEVPPSSELVMEAGREQESWPLADPCLVLLTFGRRKGKPGVVGPSTVDLVCLLKELGQAGGRGMSEGGGRCLPEPRRV